MRIILFWIAAAVLVLQFAAPVVKIVVVVAVAFAYMRLAAPHASLDHAVLVGVVWLLLDIVAELSAAAVMRHGWYGLIGSPAQDRMRDLVMLAWLAAPAVFARSQLDAGAQLDDAVGGHAEVEGGAAVIAFEDRKQHQA